MLRHPTVSTRAPLFLSLTLGLGACVVRDVQIGDGESTDEVDGDGDMGDGDMGDGDGDLPPAPIVPNKDLDILFVIDNSGSMGEEQAILAASFGALIKILEDEEVEANYRIGITTTDNGNNWCPAGVTLPEAGRLVMSSCKSRLADFLFDGGLVDVQDLACNDICGLSEAELEILPTTTDADPVAKPRPWLENIDGEKNIPSTTDSAEAFACLVPQGISGCGFESPLESMQLALTRMQQPSEASFGFIRPHAVLAVVIVTDEVDCSYNKDYADIFSAEGNKVFWSDPSSAFPTSAICWNAGVECVGDPSSYDACNPVNKSIDGDVGVADSEAVLHPLSRYVGLLQALENEKKLTDPSNEVIVTLIGGVRNDGSIVYQDTDDAVFQNSFGIGPGCSVENPDDPDYPITAAPPVRMRNVTNAFTPGNMHSICEPDYGPAFNALIERIQDQIPNPNP